MLDEVFRPEAPAIDLRSHHHPRPFGYFVKQLVWACFQPVFWPGTPRQLSVFRVALLRLFGARIGKSCLISRGTKIWEPWNLEMADYSVLGDNVEVYNPARIRIGSNCVVSQRSYLCTETRDDTDPGFPLYSSPIEIGSSAWVAAGVFVGPGVTIGEGTVVGAYSVVLEDAPPWMVCAGNPCRPIKPRKLNSRT